MWRGGDDCESFPAAIFAHEGRKEGGRGRGEAVGGAWMPYKRATAFRYG